MTARKRKLDVATLRWAGVELTKMAGSYGEGAGDYAECLREAATDLETRARKLGAPLPVLKRLLSESQAPAVCPLPELRLPIPRSATPAMRAMTIIGANPLFIFI